MGSLVAALASWLDAKAHEGQWLIRIEDIDRDRCKEHFSHLIIDQLSRCGLKSDRDIVYQSKRHHLYDAFMDKLEQRQLLYRCGCSRTQILNAIKRIHGNSDSNAQSELSNGLIYPGTCRDAFTPRLATHTYSEREPKTSELLKYAWRVKTSPEIHAWFDRRLGWSKQNIGLEVGDFVVKRVDGPFSYQLCVVADDIDQSITHVVRGEDLADNTPRQILLYQYLSTPHPQYLHVPLVKNEDGEKLSKQTLAPALELDSMNKILLSMKSAAKHLGLSTRDDLHESLETLLSDWTYQWSCKYPLNADQARR